MNAHFNTKIPFDRAGHRLDKVLAELFSDYSRARLQQWIKEGCVQINGQVQCSLKYKLQGGENVEVFAQLQEEVGWNAQDSLPLTILHADDDIIVVNKAAGVVVHPGAGNQENTLVNALLHFAPELAQLPRAGIIHRIDKDTTGVLVVARSLLAHTKLVEQLQAHDFTREYQAIATGLILTGGTVNAPIARHPAQRTRMAVVGGGKPAVTHYKVAKRFQAHTHVVVKLETGRTHQIRVHFAHIGYPLLGDPVYGGRFKMPPKADEELQELMRNFKRQALHAQKLGFIHPRTQEYVEWSVPLPEDMQALLAGLGRAG